MAHLRNRYLKSQLQNALKFSPLVGVLGQRQVGKTTLIEAITSSSNYVTFDEENVRTSASLKPKGFLEGFSSLTAIDECQKVPEIFPALKLFVQKNKKPGQFILSGSVRFTSRKAIQESLTGRLYNLELLPLTLAETHHLPFLDYNLLFNKNFEKVISDLSERRKILNSSNIEKYIEHGGLPGICFLRDPSHRANKLKSHIETLLQRDIFLIIKTTASYSSLFGLLTYLAENQGQAFSLKHCSTQCRLAQNTVKKLIDAYEALFLIRRVPGFGFRSAPLFFLEDQGMAHYLMTHKKEHFVYRFLFSQVFSNVHYTHPSKYQIGYHEYKSGSRIDLVAKLDTGNIAFIYENAEAVSTKNIHLADNYIKEFPNAKVILLTEADKAIKLAANIISLPAHWIA